MMTDQSCTIELLSAAETARRLGIAQQTLARWRWEGIGPRFCKIGSRVAYDARDLAVWIDSRRRTSTSSRGRGVAASCNP